jgi:hypothetical protein
VIDRRRLICEAFRLESITIGKPGRGMAERLRAAIEHDGDCLSDLHLWRLGPGHLGAILSVATFQPRDAEHYRRLLGRFCNLNKTERL